VSRISEQGLFVTRKATSDSDPSSSREASTRLLDFRLAFFGRSISADTCTLALFTPLGPLGFLDSLHFDFVARFRTATCAFVELIEVLEEATDSDLDFATVEDLRECLREAAFSASIGFRSSCGCFESLRERRSV